MSWTKTVVEVVVLSKGPLEFETIADLDELITNGPCSGAWDITETVHLTREEMAVELDKQGIAPEFLGCEEE
jgi:hypothetical protein